MKEFPIPVVAFGAGSQPEEEDLAYLPMPHEMDTYSMPGWNLEADPATLAATCAVLDELRTKMSAQGEVTIELRDLPAPVGELLNQSLGHGEVSALVSAPNALHIQETVFAGVWRVQQMSDQGAVLRDTLRACTIPHEVCQAALDAAVEVVAPPPRPGMMNAPAVLNELLERSSQYASGQLAHVINFSLLPMSPEDLAYLYDAMQPGPVSILSRGYGNCRITSTGLAHVWWVQYFNSMDQLILNTLEVTDVPEVALAAADDIRHSAERLDEWLTMMREQ
ncbi:MAG: hydrogenase expression/formation protein [Methylobacillus sp.]|jgi:hydrogenase-1 operon protein HyaF|nr:hydrogenase expression/formation protein [Methylobacillus sp.]